MYHIVGTELASLNAKSDQEAPPFETVKILTDASPSSMSLVRSANVNPTLSPECRFSSLFDSNSDSWFGLPSGNTIDAKAEIDSSLLMQHAVKSFHLENE